MNWLLTYGYSHIALPILTDCSLVLVDPVAPAMPTPYLYRPTALLFWFTQSLQRCQCPTCTDLLLSCSGLPSRSSDAIDLLRLLLSLCCRSDLHTRLLVTDLVAGLDASRSNDPDALLRLLLLLQVLPTRSIALVVL